MNMEACPFCTQLTNLDKTPKEDVVWQFPHSVALLGPWQYFHGYCILVYRRHATEFDQLANDERRGYFDEMCLLARAIQEGFRPHKLNYEILGNQVPHLHWHIFPRSENDPDRLRAVWLALDRAARDAGARKHFQTGPKSRSTTSQILREHLTRLHAPTAHRNPG